MRTIPKATAATIIFSLLATLTASANEPEPSLPLKRPHGHDKLEGNFRLGWESRYFSEGRDALDGDSLLTSSVEFGWKHFSGGIWYGYSPDQRYDELQLSLAYTYHVNDNFECYISYTHFQFPFENSHDDEVGIGFVWTGLPADIELSTDIYYSFDADGYFAEISAGKSFEINDHLNLNLSTIFGVNQGYVSDGHDGANHIALQLGLECAVSDSLAITVHTTYSWALDKDAAAPGDDQLIDFFHGGVGLQWSF